MTIGHRDFAKFAEVLAALSDPKTMKRASDGIIRESMDLKAAQAALDKEVSRIEGVQTYEEGVAKLVEERESQKAELKEERKEHNRKIGDQQRALDLANEKLNSDTALFKSAKQESEQEIASSQSELAQGFKDLQDAKDGLADEQAEFRILKAKYDAWEAQAQSIKIV